MMATGRLPRSCTWAEAILAAWSKVMIAVDYLKETMPRSPFVAYHTYQHLVKIKNLRLHLTPNGWMTTRLQRILHRLVKLILPRQAR